MKQSEKRKRFGRLAALTTAGWFVVTLPYAYLYVESSLGAPKLQGYESQWDWQLFFFCLTRLPWLLLLLVIALIVVWLTTRRLR